VTALGHAAHDPRSYAEDPESHAEAHCCTRLEDERHSDYRCGCGETRDLHQKHINKPTTWIKISGTAAKRWLRYLTSHSLGRVASVCDIVLATLLTLPLPRPPP
jgi:hypothetical protein